MIKYAADHINMGRLFQPQHILRKALKWITGPPPTATEEIVYGAKGRASSVMHVTSDMHARATESLLEVKCVYEFNDPPNEKMK